MEIQLGEKVNTNTCKGLVFRARINRFFIEENRIVEQFELKFLKKKSCTGCEYCGFIWEDLSEMPQQTISLSHIKDGKLYMATVTNISTDRETGYVDSWVTEFKELVEEPING